VPLSRLPSALTALKRAVRFATYDWTREMAPLRRVITMVGMGLQPMPEVVHSSERE
jgi:hypothetical protein